MLRRKSILIVEDNGVVALSLAVAVEDLGGRVIGPAASVAEALMLLETRQVSGAVLDCQLLDRDVTPVVMCLIDQGVPLVIHTANWLPSALARSLPNLPVLMKPLDSAIVVEVLANRMRDVGPSGLSDQIRLN